MLKNENVDNKKFCNLLRESKVLSDESRKNQPNFSSIIEKSSLNMNYHKRFRHQKSNKKLFCFSILLNLTKT